MSWDSTFSTNSTKARQFQLCSECLTLTCKLLVSGQQAQFVRIALAFGLTVSSCRRNLWGWFEVKSGLSGRHPGPNYRTCVRLPYQPCGHCWTYHRGEGEFSKLKNLCNTFTGWFVERPCLHCGAMHWWHPRRRYSYGCCACYGKFITAFVISLKQDIKSTPGTTFHPRKKTPILLGIAKINFI